MTLSIIDLYTRNISSPSTRLGVAIHSNLGVTLTKGSSTKSGNKYVEITLTDREGRVHKENIWFPNGKAFPRKDETEQQALQRELTEKEDQIGQLLHALVPVEEIFKMGDKVTNFEQLVDIAISLVSKFKNNKVNVKLVYDKQGKYPRIAFNDYKWIERYTEGKIPSLTYTPWEIANRTTRKSDTPSNNNLVVNSEGNHQSDEVDKYV